MLPSKRAHPIRSTYRKRPVHRFTLLKDKLMQSRTKRNKTKNRIKIIKRDEEVEINIKWRKKKHNKLHHLWPTDILLFFSYFPSYAPLPLPELPCWSIARTVESFALIYTFFIFAWLRFFVHWIYSAHYEFMCSDHCVFGGLAQQRTRRAQIVGGLLWEDACASIQSTNNEREREWEKKQMWNEMNILVFGIESIHLALFGNILPIHRGLIVFSFSFAYICFSMALRSDGALQSFTNCDQYVPTAGCITTIHLSFYFLFSYATFGSISIFIHVGISLCVSWLFRLLFHVVVEVHMCERCRIIRR